MSFISSDKICKKMKFSKGFTLVELIITIAIIAIVTAIVLTRSNTRTNSFSLQMAVDQITSDIDNVRSTAFAKHDTITVIFSIQNDHYFICTGPDNARSIITDFPGSNNGFISFASGRLASVKITSANFNSDSVLQFLPMGEVKSGGSITLNNATTITISDLTGRWSVN